MLAFIPIVPSPPPSPRAEALGQRLAETIEQFRQQDPELSSQDVEQAARLALARSGGASAGSRRPLVAAAVAVLVGLLVALGANGGRCPAQAPVVYVAVAIAVVALILVMVKRR
jgi:hypothetical protein